MCIKEGMRLHTPVSFIQRVTSQEMVIENHHIPAGTVIGIQVYITAPPPRPTLCNFILPRTRMSKTDWIKPVSRADSP